ncbi:MAG TPA: ABC transporter permease [Bryobacteraceae bacterium]|jgi:predicted permease
MWSRFRWWLRRDDEERDLDEELRAHLAIEARDRMDRGEPPERARLAARRSFGNLSHFREETRDAWGWTELERLAGDVRHGLRMLRRAPGWTATIVATLALGIGLSTAIFGVVYGVLLKPLPYPSADRLMAIWNSAPVAAYRRYNVNGVNWLTWRARAQSFEDIALARLIRNFNLTGIGEPERLQAASTSWNLFRVLQVTPLMGRVFTEKEQNGDAKVAVLSYGLWRGRFGGDPAILHRKIFLNGEPYEAIGVMRADFEYPTAQFELWTPLYLPPDELRPGLNNNYVAIGRLKPGVTVAQAQAEMSAIMRRFVDEHPQTNRIVVAASGSAGLGYIDALVEPLLTSNTLQVRAALWVLMAAVGCLLLIGALNLGSLLIARVGSRGQEIAIRAALGAGDGRLARQMLAETIPLSVAGAAGGIAVAWLLLRVFAPLFPSQIPRIETAGLNVPVLGFATGIGLLVVLLASLLPARLTSRFRISGTMQQDSRSVTGGTKARGALVVAQVTVTVVLLFAGSLFARSLEGVLRVNPGFRTDGVLTMHLAVTRAKYPRDAQVSNYYDRISDRVRALPGVIAAGFVNRLPLSGIDQTGPVEFESHLGKLIDTDWRSATPGYFEAAEIPLKRGRLFTESDTPTSPLIAVIDEQLAREVFGDRDPIGKRVRIPIADQPWTTIVGVAGHILNATPEKDIRPQIYWPESQRTQDRAALVIRTLSRPESFTAAVVEHIRKEDPDQPVYDVRTMDEWMSRTLGARDLLTWLVAFFAAASLILGCLGLYGVVSFTARARTREFGIRLALGASPIHVGRLVLDQAARLVLIGCATGLALAFPVGRAIQSLLYGVAASDAMALLIAPALLMSVAVLASLGPAWRALRIDPAAALRA